MNCARLFPKNSARGGMGAAFSVVAAARRALGREGDLFRSRRAVVKRGFTLLEMCIVLFIIALMVGVSMPAIETAYTERAVRNDSHQLALMVKTAMIQAAEQNRPYVIDLAKDTIALHPQGDQALAADSSDAADSLFNNTPDNQAAANVMIDVKATDTLDAKNRLQIPNPDKLNAWMDMPDDSQWVFQPGELCPATRVRVTRDNSWLEMGFAALTGNVENETTYFP